MAYEEGKVYTGDNVSLTEAGVRYFNNLWFKMPQEIGEVVGDQPIYQIVGTGHYFLSASKNPEKDYAIIRWSDRVWIGWVKRHMIKPGYES